MAVQTDCNADYNKVMNHCGLPYPVQECLSLLNESGYEAFVVGGAVRDMYLGRPVHDYDITTNALPEQMKQVFASHRTVETGLKHGTLTVITGQMQVEITTYRTESQYGDHRHPDAVAFTSDLAADCARRDFTINAMCFHPLEGVIDFFHGEDDLRRHIIRTVNDPAERFREDALRILRALRFAAELDFTIEAATAEAVHNARHDLSYVSAERVQSELGRLLAGPGRARILRDYRDVMEVILPELHVLCAERWLRLTEVLPDNPLAALAVLLAGTPDPSAALQRLKYSRHDQNTVQNLLAHRNDPVASRRDLRFLLSGLQAGHEQHAAFRAALDPDTDAADLARRLKEVCDDGDCITIGMLDITGTDLQAAGLRGAAIGRTLQELLAAVMEDRVVNEKTALLQAAENSYCRK